MSSSENIIEGIGNEVVWSTSGIIIVLIITVFIYYRIMSSRFYVNRHASMPAPSESYMSNRLSNDVDANRVNPISGHYGSDHQCPVCLNEPRYPVETNCGHLFCANCIITYWRHGNWIGAIRCPVCRQVVTVLLQCFTNNAEISSEERATLMEAINDYNRRFSGEPRPWLDYLWDLPTLLRHASSEFFSVGGLMYMFRLRIVLCFVAAVMYLISPLDMIPEAVFGVLGLLDDMFVMLLLAIYITVIYRRFLGSRWENQQ